MWSRIWLQIVYIHAPCRVWSTVLMAFAKLCDRGWGVRCVCVCVCLYWFLGESEVCVLWSYKHQQYNKNYIKPPPKQQHKPTPRVHNTHVPDIPQTAAAMIYDTRYQNCTPPLHVLALCIICIWNIMCAMNLYNVYEILCVLWLCNMYMKYRGRRWERGRRRRSVGWSWGCVAGGECEDEDVCKYTYFNQTHSKI